MKEKLRFVSLITLLLAVCSCASLKTKYSKTERQWQQIAPSSSSKLTHSMYLVGDAGNASQSYNPPVLKYLKTKLENESQNTSILFLGDNIYEHGMPSVEDWVLRQEAEYSIRAQLEILNNFNGRPIFIPGNHDWRGWGPKGLKRQEDFVETYLNQRNSNVNEWKNYFLPDNGCSGPEIVELNDEVVVIVVDSQWWLMDWDSKSNSNEGCESETKATFKFAFENVVRKYKNKNVVIAMHHPLYTYGPHGGGYSVKQNIFPATEVIPKLYVPLPGLGTLYTLFRSCIGSRQDTSNKRYRELRSAMLTSVKKNGSFIFVSGHEHALQYIENEEQKFIVSGSGSKSSPVKLGRGSDFATGAMGYCTLLFYKDGETWVQFWQVNKEGTESTLIYHKKIRDQRESALEKK